MSKTFKQFEESLTSQAEMEAYAKSEAPAKLIVSLHEAYYLGETEIYEELLEENSYRLDYLKLTDGDYQAYLSLMEHRDETVETDMDRYGLDRYQKVRHQKFEELNKVIRRFTDDKSTLENITNFVKFGGLSEVDEADFQSIADFRFDHIQEFMGDEMPNAILEDVKERNLGFVGNPFVEPHLEMKMCVLDEVNNMTVERSSFLIREAKSGATIIQLPHTKGKKNAQRASNIFGNSVKKKAQGALSISVTKPMGHPKAKGYYSSLAKLDGKPKKTSIYKNLSGGKSRKDVKLV